MLPNYDKAMMYNGRLTQNQGTAFSASRLQPASTNLRNHGSAIFRFFDLDDTVGVLENCKRLEHENFCKPVT